VLFCLETIFDDTMRTLCPYLLFFLTISLFSCSRQKSDTSYNNNKPIKADTYETPQNSITGNHPKVTINRITASTYDAVKKSGEVQAGKYNGKTISIYDNKGVLLEISYYSPKNELLYKDINEYDSVGRCKGTTRNLPEGKRGIKIVPKYNDKGLRIEDDWYNPDGIIYCKILKNYNESGKMVESKTYNSLGTLLQHSSSYTYNDSGDVKECIFYKPDGRVENHQTYEYKDFDDVGNWRTSITYKNTIAAQIIKRDIQYTASMTITLENNRHSRE
jgi:hypothetical protein